MSKGDIFYFSGGRQKSITMTEADSVLRNLMTYIGIDGVLEMMAAICDSNGFEDEADALRDCASSETIYESEFES